jgi:PAS domain S-box-containing protein
MTATPSRSYPENRDDAFSHLLFQATLLQQAPDAIIGTDPEGTIITWNRSAEALFLYSDAEVLGQPITLLLPPGYEEEHQRIIERIHENEIVVVLETQRRCKNGHVLDISLAASPVRNAQGHLLGIASIVRDITQHKQVQEELESVSRFPSENPNPVMRVANNGILLYANESSYVVRRTWDTEVGDRLPRPWRDIVRKAAQSGKSHELILDCDEKIFLLELVPVANNNYVNIYGRDDTKRQRAEKHLRILEEVAASLSAALTPTQVTEVIVHQAFVALGATAGSVAQLVENGTMLEIVNAFGYSDKLLQNWQRFSVALPTVALAHAVRSKKNIFIGSKEEKQRLFPPDPHRPTDFEHESWAALPLIVNKRVIGGLGISFPTQHTFAEEECHFFAALADHCAQALERAWLTEHAKEAAAIQERQRLARDLHDAVSQVLFSSATIAEALHRQWQRNPQVSMTRLEYVVTLNRAAMAEMRMLLLELRPEFILQNDLGTLLNHIMEAAKGRKQITGEIIIQGDLTPLPTDVHIALYRIAQESIHNVLKHSQAKHLSIQLDNRFAYVELAITDNGDGFDPAQSLTGMGLKTMQERADGIGALFTIESQPGIGTRIITRWSVE